MSDILWPGSILDAATIPTGEYSPIIAERAPLTLSHDIPGASAKVALESATLLGFREAFAKLLNSIGTAQRPAKWEYLEELLYSENQLSVALGGHYKKGSLEISAGLDFSTSSTKSKVLVDRI
jgi:thiol-activated cytolysin